MQWTSIGLFTLALISAVAFVYSFFRASVSKDTIQSAKDTIEILNDKINAQVIKSGEQDKAIFASEQKIKDLEAEINIIKTLPLQQLSGDYHKIVDTLNLMAEHVGKVNKILDDQGKIINWFYEEYHKGNGFRLNGSSK